MESGLSGYEATNWLGLLAPAATPPEIISKLNVALRKGLAEHETNEKLAALGLEMEDSTPQQFGELIKSEIVRWRPVIKASGAKPQ